MPLSRPSRTELRDLAESLGFQLDGTEFDDIHMLIEGFLGGFDAVAESAEPVAPCGACRQVLAEFCDDLEIILADSSGVRMVTRLSELLPQPFGADQLGGADTLDPL